MTTETPADAYVGQAWFGPGVAGIGAASFLADVGHEIPTALLPSFLTSTLGAPASALGVIEGVSDALAGVARLGGGALADDPQRRRSVAVGGCRDRDERCPMAGGGTPRRGVDGPGAAGPSPQRSGDRGASWSRVGSLPGSPQALLATGEAYYAAAHDPDGTTGIYRSSDGGRTWALFYRDRP